MSTQDTPAPAELAYREVSGEGYAAAAAAFRREVTARHTLVFSGPCPRCGHVMEYLVSRVVVKGRGRWTRATPPPSETPEPEDMCCTCEQAHPGRPAEYLGCGAYWTVPAS